MNIKFSERVSKLKASEIRELLKLTEEPEIISFAGGLPAPELFPKEKMEEIAAKVVREEGEAALQYGSTEGIPALRKIIAEQRLTAAGIKNPNKDEIMLTSGSQQGIEFSAKIFVNEGDVIICESPSYLGAINAFKSYQPKFVEVPMDDDGLIVEELEKAIKENPNAKMIYTIPDFQNPTGKRLPAERRKKVAELAAKYEIPVIEDAPYGELLYEGEKIPSIKSFDEAGYVVYLGTFSKTFCPGLRLGWVYATDEILQKYIIVKQGVDLQTSSFDQRLAAAFMSKYDLNQHIAEINKVYKKRRELMFDSMDKYFPTGVEYTRPQGGLFLWVTLKEGVDAAELMKEALAEKVAFVPGGAFYPNGGNKNHFRLNFSNMTEDKIVEGIKRLGNVLKKYY
ncbi:2-aminoadipate transaminase [Clostridium acetireducens DSM 10703]|jgi:2-aminoadipate transaminase|uniref:2-aminoadipate transaminase n=1 Tax=Clostridium acetireducens DSM 10703 TaxID=1121290 RepID=A0A1E8F284_9CLOT|nr:PLP-dependent aminotransferase family protein [Clostridium acetireducens]OFI07762.1 2-aminoadipate transaminase [Clostridium acetireducens DSM 10703]